MGQPNASGTPRAAIVGDGDTFTVDGRKFRLEVKRDDCMGPPWKEDDGHGVVSDWTNINKRPSERLLHEDHGFKRYYDVQASIAIARKDWGFIGAAAAKAVEADYQRLRGWCNDEWNWVYLVVTLIDGGLDKGEFESLGGLESDCEEYIGECAHELAGQLLARVVEPWGDGP